MSDTLETYIPAQAGEMTFWRVLRAYVCEAQHETRRMFRTPVFTLVFLCLPVLLYLLFGLVIVGQNPNAAAGSTEFLFVGFVVVGIMGPGLFGFGQIVANEREQGLVQFKRALPMPTGAYLFAKLFMAMTFAAFVVATLLVAGGFTSIQLTMASCFRLAAAGILGAIPFAAIGFLIGVHTSSRGAIAIVNVVYQVMMHMSGLFFVLPGVLLSIAPIWPTYHLQQIMFFELGLPTHGSLWGHVAALLAMTLICTVIAWRRLKRSG